MHHKIISKCLFVFVIVFLTTNVWGKSLPQRLGIGYSNQFSTDLPSIMAKYYPSEEFAMSAALGINSGAADSKFGFLVKVYKTIFPEDNMNFYMGAGGGLLSNKVGTKNESGFELMGYAGGEFFLPGLDSLGFVFEAGVGVVSVSSGVTFRTIGHSPLNAGIIFYF